MLTIVASDSAMSSLCFYSPVRSIKNGSHKSERAKALGQKIALDISVVIFAGPYIPTIRLDDIGNHIVNEAVLIPQFFGFKFLFILRIVQTLENILEFAIVFLEDRVFGGKVQRVILGKSVLEAGVGESYN